MNFTQETIWDVLIGLAGVYFLLRILIQNKGLKKLKKDVDSCTKTVTEEVDRATFDGIETEAVIRKNTDFKAIDTLLKKYNELSAKLNADIQLISLFPMAGLLGTVWGLMSAMKDSANKLDLNSLSLALSTTLVGLICAMILKFIATKCSIKEMEIIENKLSEADRKYNQLISRGKFINRTNNSEGNVNE